MILLSSSPLVGLFRDNETNNLNETTWLRIPPGRRRTSWLFYKHGRGFELGTTVKQIQLAVRTGLELGASGLQVQRSNHSTTLPLQLIISGTKKHFGAVYLSGVGGVVKALAFHQCGPLFPCSRRLAMLAGRLSFLLVTRLFARVSQTHLTLRSLTYFRPFVPPLARNVLALRKNTVCFAVCNL